MWEKKLLAKEEIIGYGIILRGTLRTPDDDIEENNK